MGSATRIVATTLPVERWIWVTVPSLMLATNAHGPPSVIGPGVCPTLTLATTVQCGGCGVGVAVCVCVHAPSIPMAIRTAERRMMVIA